MRLLKGSQIIRVVVLLIGLVIITRCTSVVFTEDDSTKKDEIVANLENKSERVRKSEVARIKEIRRTQINALLQILIDYQQDVINKRPQNVPLCPFVDLLGDLRATEAVDPLITLACFAIDRIMAKGGFSSELMSFKATISALQNALAKIGKPAVPSLINLLKVETSNSPNPYDAHSNKSRFARKVLYMIEGNCAIHRLESAYKAETDKKKKARLKEAITKFQSEFKLKAK